MIEIKNEDEFIKQLLNIATNQLKPEMDTACDIGYVTSKVKSPDATGIMRSHIKRGRGKKGRRLLYVTTFGFDNLDAGRKNALSIMENGLVVPIYIPTQTRAMQDWLLAINNPALFGKSQILVGRNQNSRYKGGDKNPIQIGRNESKKYIEKKFNIKFK